MTTINESDRAKARAREFLLFLSGQRDGYIGETMLMRKKLRIPLKIAKEANRILRHL
jgi:hypothetical protein